MCIKYIYYIYVCILGVVDSTCSDCAVVVISVRAQTLGWLTLHYPTGGKGEALVVYNPFTAPGLRSCPLITPLRRKNSLTLGSNKRLPLLILKTWQNPC